jgi:Amt family ammonium transporter
MTTVDAVWVAVAAALVMAMQVGFCMLETGLVRSKNTINVACKNIVDFCLAGLLFWACSYALMFGSSPSGWVGTAGFLFDPGQNGWAHAMFFLFQLMFCATAATIVSGAVAERMSFRGYLLITALVSGLLYPIAGGWAWNENGWLGRMGFVDFAGATVVHSAGGWVALAAVVVLGPRIGRFNSSVSLASPHSLVTSTVGVLILFVGWLGFNGGSTLAVSREIPTILVNTVLGGCAGCLVGMACGWVRKKMPALPESLNGCIAGLVSVTAACHAIQPLDAVILGSVGGALSVLGVFLLERCKVDDVVGAWAAHALPGVWGTLGVALFGDPAALDTGLGFAAQLGVQALGVTVFFLWAGVLGWLLISLLNRVVPLRISAEGERIGLNVAEHGASTEIIDLLNEMTRHSGEGDFTSQLDFQPFTEVGQIATQYNKVLGKVVDEMDLRESIASRLDQERHALEQSRTAIVSSIEYAKRLQDALLPRPETLRRILPDAWVLNLPRDIVSGDFYWMARRGESTFVALVDCTGHGVPGAFMSMMGFALLQEIVVERRVDEPAEILDLLHHRIRLALGQDRAESGNRDGMEVALVRVDADRAHFAGAGLSLWWVDGKAQGEIPGDRHSLGGGRHEPSRLSFTQHVLPKKPGLSVVLTSDGLLHQPNHLKKMLEKPGFRLWLSELGKLEPESRTDWLKEQLRDHRGGATQRDDILVLGFSLQPGDF